MSLHIDCNKCAYESKLDTLLTSGVLHLDDDTYDIEYIESRDSLPTISVTNDDTDIEYRCGGIIYGNMSDALFAKVVDIYRAMARATEQYQSTNPDAIIARLSYDGASSKKNEIIMLSVGPCRDKTAELSGYINVNGATLEYFANREGTLIGLTPDGGVMMPADNLPFSNTLECEITDAVHNGIDTYLRDEAIYKALSESSGKSISCLCIDDIDR